MKKALFIAGIACFVTGIVFLLLGVLYWSGYFRVYDGSPELYRRLHQRMIFSFVRGFTLEAMGAVCIIIRSRI